MLGKQAKTLTRVQAKAVLAYLARTRLPARNTVIFLLSTNAGLRAKEIAALKWSMVVDAQAAVASEIALTNSASKGNSGRMIPVSRELHKALVLWKESCGACWPDANVISTERSSATSAQMIVNLFRSWYRKLGFNGCSSHSGRRTFITNAARKISLAGGSLRDVQALAGHSSLSTTQRYIEINHDAKRKIVELIGV
jgi:integrase